ncbi:MAG: EamA family transporter [Leptolyngbya sp. BL-A-14]
MGIALGKHLVLVMMVIAQVWGDVWLSRGMRHIGALHPSLPATPAAIVDFGAHVLTNLSIVTGVLFLISSLLLYLVAVSRHDLSYVLPLTASKYVLAALFAWLMLKESVSDVRWLGTALISAGVVLVSLSERLPSQGTQQRRNTSQFVILPLAVTSLSLTLAQIWLAIGVMVVAASAGDILVAAGMKRVGEVPKLEWHMDKVALIKSLFKVAQRVLTSPLIGLGVLCMAVDFFLFIALLSRADLSLITPMTALSYPISILGSHYFLKERLTSGRLMGASIIGIGVALISLNAHSA